MSILLSIFLMVGVASSRHVSIHNDARSGAYEEPIELPEARRICASLCMSGLGGKPCGGDCANIQPNEFGNQSAQNSTGQLALSYPASRKDACPLLCSYQLGDPLCDCPPPQNPFDSIFFQVDFDEICGFFCTQHRYKIYGCHPCAKYAQKQEHFETYSTRKKHKVDWDAWCREKCSEGDGGVACNCDILPLSLQYAANDLDKPKE